MGNTYDLAIIGAGPAGYVAAIRASQLGKKTAIVDKRSNLGGTCMNIGCIPSKALLHSSELYMEMQNYAATHGILIKELSADVNAMQKRKEGIVDKLNSGIQALMKGNSITTFQGTATIKDPQTVEVTGAKKEVLQAKQIIIATGSIPVELPTIPFNGKSIISSTEALEFNKPPKTLLIVGGGAIGLEMGSVWSRLGSEVTIVEAMPEVLPGWDGQLAKAVHKELNKQGIKINTNKRISSSEITKDKQVVLNTKEGELARADVVLVAIGRKPMTEGIGIEALDIKMEGKQIWVDENYRTSCPSIYAIGDVIRGPMLAHKAEEEAIIVVERMTGMQPSMNYAAIPNIVYTHPEVASVGLTEEQLKEQNIEYVSSSAKFAANGRALSMGATMGFAKILAKKHSDTVLGVHIIGPQASSLISEAVSVIEFGGSSEDIARTVHSHPTLTEVLKEAALGIAGHKIHGL